MSVEVLTVSSKGQVVLPVAMRVSMDIQPGDKLAAYATDDLIMLKVLRLPTQDEFLARLDEAQAWAASVGYVESDVEDAVKRVRRRNARENRH